MGFASDPTTLAQELTQHLEHRTKYNFTAERLSIDRSDSKADTARYHRINHPQFTLPTVAILTGSRFPHMYIYNILTSINTTYLSTSPPVNNFLYYVQALFLPLTFIEFNINK